MNQAPVGSGVQVEDLRVSLVGGEPIIEGASLSVKPGEAVGIVGESGSGKTTLALALMGYTADGVAITGGTISVAGELILGRPEKEARSLRGRVISYVPQDPATSLNPARRIGRAIEAMLDTHLPEMSSEERVRVVLGQVGLPTTSEFARRFPHQLSGGQQQRVTIASAISCEPPVVVLDEPTTGLDVITQSRVIGAVDRLRRERQLGLVFVSHDLAVVSQIADRVAVMYAGRIVEEGPTETVLSAPRHPYTRGLIAAIPDPSRTRRLRGIPGIAVGVGERPEGCSFAPRCSLAVPDCRRDVPGLTQIAARHAVRCIRCRAIDQLDTDTPEVARHTTGEPLLIVENLSIEHGSRRRGVRVVHGVDLQVGRGECLALIGESGSGKTTIARCIAGLHSPAEGRIVFDSSPLEARAQKRSKDARRRIQYVFQNPYDSLNPRQSVHDQVLRPVKILLGLRGAAAEQKINELLERVRLPRQIAKRFPAELSGGERQRVAVGRALAPEPELLICDEITSALDVSVQAAVLELLEELREELGLAMLFITHDLGVVSSIADRGAVLQHGRICETAPVRELLDTPAAEYTAQLLSSAPRLLSTGRGEVFAAADDPPASAGSAPGNRAERSPVGDGR